MAIAEDVVIIGRVLNHRTQRAGDATFNRSVPSFYEPVVISARNAQWNRPGQSCLLSWRHRAAYVDGGRVLWHRRNTDREHATNQRCPLRNICHRFSPLLPIFPRSIVETRT